MISEFENHKGFDKMEYSRYAYIPEMDAIIEYEEACSLENKEKWHDEICERRNFVGLGYIVGTTFDGNYCWSMEKLSLIYV